MGTKTNRQRNTLSATARAVKRLRACATGILALGALTTPRIGEGGTPVTVTSHLPQANLVADGTTLYKMNVRVDSTAGLAFTNWDVLVLNRFATELTPPYQPQIPSENDYFEGVAMDPSWNFVDTTPSPHPNGEIFSANSRNTTGIGVAGNGDLENVYFRVNTDAPIGPVTCQNCWDNFILFGINFSDPQGNLYTTGNGGITVFNDPYSIHEVGDINFDIAVDHNDIPLFVGALLDLQAYQEQREQGTIGSADMNLDGVVDARDIQGLVDRIVGGP